MLNMTKVLSEYSLMHDHRFNHEKILYLKDTLKIMNKINDDQGFWDSSHILP